MNDIDRKLTNNLSGQRPMPETMRAHRRLTSIDGLRAVMCIGVALYHFVPYFFTPGDATYEVSRYFSYFTDVFAILAGVFSARYIKESWSVASYGGFLGSRLSRIYPLHVITLGFYLVILIAISAGLFSPQNQSRYDPSAIIPHLTLTHAWGIGPSMAFNYPSWMISAILACYLTIPILGKFYQMSKLLVPGLLVVAIAVCSYVADLSGVEITRAQFVGIGVLRVFPSFMFGIFLGNIEKIPAHKAVPIVTLIASLVAAFGLGMPLTGIIRLLVLYVMVYSIFVADKLSINTPLNMGLFQSLSKYSFGVYLWHGVVATVLFRVFVPRAFSKDALLIGSQSPLYASILLLIGLILSFGIAFVSLKTVERWGSRAFEALLNR
jgi:peptidoglycan/LPS O-acetylase OafA/YrhL